MEQLIGQVLNNQYRLTSLLGRQVGRRTFLADNIETGSQVVIKILLFSPEFNWNDHKLFQREAETLKSLKNSTIPQYLDYFDVETELGKGFALVQSYIEAKSLQDWIESGRTFREEDIKDIAKQLLNILHYLHQRQPPVIHRDIKPSNILLSDRSGHHTGQVYLVDFGAVQTVLHSGTKTVVGTYGYMPFEQFGDRCVPASDLYAVGATLIYLATGYPPSELPQKEMRLLFEDKANLSANLVDWLQWLTEPSLDLRLNSAQNALEALEQPRLSKNNLTKVSKPAESKIQLTQTAEMLDILIPTQRFSNSPIYLIGLVVILASTTVTFYKLFIATWTSGIPLVPFVMAFFAIITLVVSIFLFYGGILMLFGNISLRITSSEIIFGSKISGFMCRLWCKAPRENIIKLEQTSLSYQKIAHLDQDQQAKIPPRIILWVGTKKFSLGDHLSDSELDWLAYHLSDWLELPITKN